METIKALHIIFMVTWFAGLFYMFRLFVYQAEAEEKEELERNILVKQYRIMQWRLWYIITSPGAILTVLFGLDLLWMHPVLLSQPWMIVKLFFVAILVAYHFWGHRIFKAMYLGKNSYKPITLRFLNEISTLILISVVFLVVRKDELSWVWGVLSIVGIALIITFAVRRYAALRRGKDSELDGVE